MCQEGTEDKEMNQICFSDSDGLEVWWRNLTPTDWFTDKMEVSIETSRFSVEGPEFLCGRLGIFIQVRDGESSQWTVLEHCLYKELRQW